MQIRYALATASTCSLSRAMSLFGVFPKVRPYSLLNWDAERYPTRRLAMPASIIVDSIRRPASRSSTYRWSSFPGQVSEIEMPGSGARRTALRQRLQVREEMMAQTLGIGAAAVSVGEGERVSPAPGTVHRSPGEGLARIETRALRKVYVLPRGRRRRGGPNGAPGGGGPAPVAGAEAPREIVALEGLDLDVPSGEFFGLLGPNGAGKTTTIGILTTRVRPTSGGASVGGVSVVEDPVGVRRRIGVVPQRPNPDRVLTALENLVYHATYFGIGLGEAMTRARALLDRFGLGQRGDAKVDQLSGGQQQRLMVARALIHDPIALFLDEPTVGLDPQARLDLWDILRTLHAEGRTIVLTTHYMEEADRLCERLAIVDRGRLLALDTPAALKSRAPGGTLVELMLDGDAGEVLAAAGEVTGMIRLEADGAVLRGWAERGGEVIPPLIKAAESGGRAVRDIHLAPPSLETLFVSMTGRKLGE